MKTKQRIHYPRRFALFPGRPVGNQLIPQYTLDSMGAASRMEAGDPRRRQPAVKSAAKNKYKKGPANNSPDLTHEILKKNQMKKFIKNYFMAIVAVMMVVGFSAFKLTETNTEEAPLKGCAVKVPDDLVQFVYDTSNGFDESEVTDPDNWFHDELEEAECDTELQRACVIRVSRSFVDDNDPNDWKLKPSINLVADEYQTNVYYIISSDDTAMDPINQTYVPN